MTERDLMVRVARRSGSTEAEVVVVQMMENRMEKMMVGKRRTVMMMKNTNTIGSQGPLIIRTRKKCKAEIVFNSHQL